MVCCTFLKQLSQIFSLLLFHIMLLFRKEKCLKVKARTINISFMLANLKVINKMHKNEMNFYSSIKTTTSSFYNPNKSPLKIIQDDPTQMRFWLKHINTQKLWRVSKSIKFLRHPFDFYSHPQYRIRPNVIINNIIVDSIINNFIKYHKQLFFIVNCGLTVNAEISKAWAVNLQMGRWIDCFKNYVR